MSPTSNVQTGELKRQLSLEDVDTETQVFTPSWVADFLAQNSIGRLWRASRPGTRVLDDCAWWVEMEDPAGMCTVESPEEIRVIDPACGTANLLVAAFDVLHKIYEECGYKRHQIPALILTHNLVGRDIDVEAAKAGRAVLEAHAHTYDPHFYRRGVVPDVRAVTDQDHPDGATYGSLLREIDAGGYHVVIANPPYAGASKLPPAMRKWAKKEYPDSCKDLCTMFMERGMELLVPGGLSAMLTSDSWMALSSFERLRVRMMEEMQLVTLAHLGRDVFDREASVSVTAFITANLRGDGEFRQCLFRMVDVDKRRKQYSLKQAILSRRLECAFSGPEYAGQIYVDPEVMEQVRRDDEAERALIREAFGFIQTGFDLMTPEQERVVDKGLAAFNVRRALGLQVPMMPGQTRLKIDEELARLRGGRR